MTLAVSALTTAPSAQTVYHDETVTYHWGRYLALRQAGFRMVSLDVAGDLTNHRWAAVWEPDPSGSDWVGEFGVGATDFALWRLARSNEGYRDAWITSAGEGSNRVYGGIMIRDSRSAVAFTDLSESQFESFVDNWDELEWALVSASVHGSAGNPRYAAVFVENPERLRWGLTFGNTVAEHGQKYDTFVNQCWCFPMLVTASASQKYLAIYSDRPFTSTWAHHLNLTKAQFVSLAQTLWGQGFEAYQITVAGTGAAARYAAIFKSDAPPVRQVTKTGPVVAQFAPIDDYMVGTGGSTGFMQQNNVRDAALAICKDGRLVFARGYTFAEPWHPITQPTTGFRIASLAKPITAVATMHLIRNQSALSLDSRLTQLVPIGTPADPRAHDITLRHLINHRSGYTGSWPADTTNKLARAQSDFQTQLLDAAPGTNWDYSNAGYQMLGLTIEQRASTLYGTYLDVFFMHPFGITRHHFDKPTPYPGDARFQEGIGVGARLLRIEPSVVLAGAPLVNRAYSLQPACCDATGGQIMSPVDYVRFLSGVFDSGVALSPLDRLAKLQLVQLMQENNGGHGGWDFAADTGKHWLYKKGGRGRSAHTHAVYRSDDVSIAVFCVGPDGPDIDVINALVNQVASANDWPAHDLFPSYGLPEFSRLDPGVTTSFGLTCVDGRGVQTTGGYPEIGYRQTFSIDTGKPLSFTALMIGFSRTSLGGVPLPIDLSLIGAPGCSLLVSQDATIPTRVGGSGIATVSLYIPDQASLVGASYFTQFAVVDPGANALGLTFSNGIDTMIGG